MDKLVSLRFEGDVGIVTLERPGQANALDVPMIEALDQCFADAEKTARAVILQGAGKSFCAGFGIGADLDISDPAFDAGAVLESHLNGLMRSLRSYSLPIVTSVRGAAAGAGAALALIGDLVVASNDAFFVQAFRHIGLVPDSGASWMLARTIGRARAMELLLLGGRLEAAIALDWGLINRVVTPLDLEASAMKLANSLAAGPKYAMAMTRAAVWSAFENGFTEQLSLERELQRRAGHLDDFREGVAAFREKRPAKFAMSVPDS